MRTQKAGILFAVLIGAIVVSLLGRGKAQTADQRSEQIPTQTGVYQRPVARVKGGDRSVDFKEMRLAFADYSELHTVPDRQGENKAMNEALKAHQCEAALKHADAVLDAEYVDMDAHYAEYVANRD
jgi:hypothetical protein